MAKLKPEIKELIDSALKSLKLTNYTQLQWQIKAKFDVNVSKATLSKRAKLLGVRFPSGRKRIVAVENRPPRGIYLSYAGAFFLKGAELRAQVLNTFSQLLKTDSNSLRARHALSLAQKINAVLLYAPIFGVDKISQIANFQCRDLLYLSGQADLPTQNQINQYLQFLANNKMLHLLNKELMKNNSSALYVRVDFGAHKFYLDVQGRTVWPTAKIPECFNTTYCSANSYVLSNFIHPSAKTPLILQASSGYNTLPPQMCSLIYCLNHLGEEPLTRISLEDKSAAVLAIWRNSRPSQKGYFIVPLSPWQYAKLAGTQMIKDFRQYQIGPEKESMAIAEANINLYDSQLSKNIKVRAALIRRKNERLALITNIGVQQERYIQQIAQKYFWRWPAQKTQNYYDLLETAHQQMLEMPQQRNYRQLLSLDLASATGLQGFKLLLEYLHYYAQEQFFPSGSTQEQLSPAIEKLYRHPGYLKPSRDYVQVFLTPFGQNQFQQAVQQGCQRFNQSGILLPNSRKFHIYCPAKNKDI